MRMLSKHKPSPAMIVALIALSVALAGTAYAAQTINGGAIKKQTIGGGKLKKKTLTGFQINTNKLGVVPTAKRAAHTYWAVVNNPPGAGNATLARASDAGIDRSRGRRRRGDHPSRSTSAAAPTSPAATTPARRCPARATRRPTSRRPIPTRSKCARATKKAPTPTPTST